MTTTENIKAKLSNSISFKLGVILLLIILLQIPLSFVKGLIYERQELQHQAQRDINNRWGSEQYLGSPILNSYSANLNMQNSSNQNNNTNYQLARSIHSDVFKADIQLDAEKRYLGIYEAAIYVSHITMSGSINLDELSQDRPIEMKIFIPLKQPKGLKQIEEIIINGQPLEAKTHLKTINNMSGIEIDLNQQQTNKINYEISLSLVGSNQFDILPLAKNTTVNIKSNWASPSFIGDSLPDERQITEKGFTATWHVNNLFHSSFKQTVLNNNQNNQYLTKDDSPTIGVKIIIPANVYQVNQRTVKYSFLIVLLTFTGFFLAELFFNLRLHPFQYLLIGVSLTVFYLLLLSLSEYLRFNTAFIISASSIIVLIAGYCSVVLQQRKRGIYTGILFAVLYGFIFVLVKAEETSLLMGAIGVWLMLALVMYLTRKIDWYKVNVSAIED